VSKRCVKALFCVLGLSLAKSMDAPITCLCGQAQQEVALAADAFPVKGYLCHCDTCRWTSGMLCTTYVELASPPTSFANLTNYKSSEGMSRSFCRTCGAHLFVHEKSTGRYWVCSGAIEHRGDVVRITHHEWVADTGDGGLAPFLTRIQQRELAAYAKDSVQQVVNFAHENGGEDAKPAGPPVRNEGPTLPTPFLRPRKKVHARCHCGDVEYYVTPPGELSTELSSPWPDLLVPYHSGSPENKRDVKWWMRAEDTKFLAGLCACRSCRLASGFPIQAWAFIPKANITKPDSSPVDFSLGALRQYQSSPGIFREFCSICGATAFWHCEERPDLIDVSVGLLRSETGARAEDLLEWETGRVSFKEEALDQELVAALELGLKGRQSEQLNEFTAGESGGLDIPQES
jgi:hypothetical protein